MKKRFLYGFPVGKSETDNFKFVSKLKWWGLGGWHHFSAGGGGGGVFT